MRERDRDLRLQPVLHTLRDMAIEQLELARERRPDIARHVGPARPRLKAGERETEREIQTNRDTVTYTDTRADTNTQRERSRQHVNDCRPRATTRTAGETSR